MENLFLSLLNMSITASWIVLTILLIRLLFRRMPKFIGCMLWGLVGLRLISPFSIESIFSLLPSAETIPNAIITENSFDIHSGVPIIDNRVNDYLSDRYYEGVTVPNDNGIRWMRIFTAIWLIGMVLLLGYTVFSYLRLRVKVRVSMRFQENIYLCDSIDTPFILGIFAPKIYLPSGLTEEQIAYILAHETAHLRRKDHLIKPLGFLLLTVYWFNPILWLAYILLCRDIELACDEKVIGKMDATDKKAYSATLLSCSVKRHMIAACPLAFGEVGIKQRIRSVLNYKKPAFWVILIAVLLSIALAVGFLTDPIGKRLTDIEPWTKTLLHNIEEIEISTADSTHIYNEGDSFEQLTDQLQKLRLREQPVSQSLAEDRSAAIQIKLLPSEEVLCFNNDCSEVWIYNEVKSTYTYRVKNPQILLKNGSILPGSLAIEDRIWQVESVQSCADGSIVAGIGDTLVSYPDAQGISYLVNVGGSQLYLLNQIEDERYLFDCQLTQKAPDSYLYELTSQQTGAKTTATVGIVRYYNQPSEYTLIFTAGDYVIYCKEYNAATKTESDSFLSFERYTCWDSPESVQPELILSLVDNSFTFRYSLLSSYIARGSYALMDDNLICTTDDGLYTYRFKVTRGNQDIVYACRFSSITFDAKNSSEIPKYRYSADAVKAKAPIEDGSVFYYVQGKFDYTVPTLLAETMWDIDRDGTEEYCTINMQLSPQSAYYKATFQAEQKLADSDVSEVEYQAEINLPTINVTFITDEDGGCILQVWDHIKDENNVKYAAPLTAYRIIFQNGEVTFEELSPTPLDNHTSAAPNQETTV